MTGPSELGSMCRKTMALCLTPRARAASTWSLRRWASIEPRSRRAKIGTCTVAMAMMTVHCDGFGASAAIETASSSEGIDSMTSTTRMTRESTQPPKAPARVPRAMPPMSPKSVAKTPTMSVWRAPTSSRDSRSRPNSSDPSGKPGIGPGMLPGVRFSLSSGSRARVVGGDPRCDERQQDEGEGDGGSEEEHRVAPQARPGARDERDATGVLDLAGRADVDVLDGGRAAATGGLREGVDAVLLRARARIHGGGGHAGHLVRTRGSITAYMMSTSRLTMT